MTTLLVILVIIIVILLIKSFSKKPVVTYKHQYYSIQLKDVKNLPNWLEDFGQLTIKRTAIITHHKKFNSTNYEYSYDLYYKTDDVDDIE